MDVNNEVCFSSGRKLERCVAALINDRIKIILRITQLLNLFESNVIKNGQNIKVRLGSPINHRLVMKNHNVYRLQVLKIPSDKQKLVYISGVVLLNKDTFVIFINFF